MAVARTTLRVDRAGATQWVQQSIPESVAVVVVRMRAMQKKRQRQGQQQGQGRGQCGSKNNGKSKGNVAATAARRIVRETRKMREMRQQ